MRRFQPAELFVRPERAHQARPWDAWSCRAADGPSRVRWRGPATSEHRSRSSRRSRGLGIHRPSSARLRAVRGRASRYPARRCGPRFDGVRRPSISESGRLARRAAPCTAAPDALWGTRQSIQRTEIPALLKMASALRAGARQLFGRHLRVVERSDDDRQLGVGRGIQRKRGGEHHGQREIQSHASDGDWREAHVSCDHCAVACRVPQCTAGNLDAKRW